MLFIKVETSNLLFKLKNVSRLEIAIILLGILIVIPLLVISLYNNPSADDFCYHCRSRNLGFFQAQLKWYESWSGRYTSSAILSLKPLVSGSFIIYKILPITLLILFYYSIHRLITLIFDQLKKSTQISLAFFLLSLYLIQAPSISQAFYWLAGSATYQVPNILTVFMFYSLIKLLKTTNKKHLIYSIIFSFFIIGGNEISLIFIDLVVAAIFFLGLIEKKQINYSLLILLIFMFFFSIFSISAPGNSIRTELSTNTHLFFPSLVKSILKVKSYLGLWLPLVVLSSFIIFDYIQKTNKVIPKLFNANLFFTFIVVFSLPFIGFFVTYWSSGEAPPARTINVIYLYFLFGLIYLFFAILFKSISRNKEFLSVSKWVKYFLLIIILIQLGRENNIRTAYADLLQGTAYKYNLQLKNRYSNINESEAGVILTPKLRFQPKTIFRGDITDSSQNWMNKCYDSYFGRTIITTE